MPTRATNQKTPADAKMVEFVEPMEAKSVATLPDGLGWQFEPKWDGFRCIVIKDGDDVSLMAKSGKPLSRYFPEVVEAVRGLPLQKCVLDGELTIPSGGTLSFDALQARLHPAESRIRRLSAETPSVVILFDLLKSSDHSALWAERLERRRTELEAFFQAIPDKTSFRLSPLTYSRQEAEAWLSGVGGALDGVIAKRTDGAYEAGKRTMLKIKHIRSADCVVGGFRYGRGNDKVASLLLGLFNDMGQLDHVGFTSGIGNAERAQLTSKLDALRGGEGFTGKAPGAPSRWSSERSTAWVPLRHELVVEVLYDHVTGNRFRHGTSLHRWRPDKAPRQCKLDQLEQETVPPKLITELLQTGSADQSPR